MFDKFIESGAEADQNSRRGYFLVSTIAIGILFVTGVIASIYAQDIALGTDEFELSSIIAPVPEVPEPPQPEHAQPQSQRTDRMTLPTRVMNIARVDEVQPIPDTPSVVPNTYLSRPPGDFVRDTIDRFGSGAPSTDRPVGSGHADSTGSKPIESTVVEPDRAPPPVIRPKAPVSKGVVNGLAIDLPKPLFTKMAQSVGAGGDVTVQVLIDERGNVVSAKALRGHPLLLQESERAAKRARFKPTLLSDVPVKVTGVITYRFSK
ncbi:MAG TPA: energy transducer TonB [Pyrinomonadaceae bacterium]|nr:energy transducer TonB [Pyrinomonadaceae bacterium]